MGQKVNKMPFFTTFHEKNNALMPICYPKTSILWKKTLHNCPYFTNKTSFLSKIQFSHDIFVEILMKNLLLWRSNLVKKSILSKPHYIIDKKKWGCPFFFDFSRKSHCSGAYILLTKRPFSKNNPLLSCLYFIKKMSILSKTWCSNVIFFEFCMTNPLLSCPYLVQKKSNFS